MGLLATLFGNKKPEFTDRIWLTTASKMTDLVSQVRNAQERGVNAVVVTHFQATHRFVLEALDKAGVRVHAVTNSTNFPSSVLDVLGVDKPTVSNRVRSRTCRFEPKVEPTYAFARGIIPA